MRKLLAVLSIFMIFFIVGCDGDITDDTINSSIILETTETSTEELTTFDETSEVPTTNEVTTESSITTDTLTTIEQKYILKFLDYDDTVLYEESYDYNTDLSELVVEDPTREGYTFDGWDSTMPLSMPENDVLIKATYSINQYTITFNSNEGTNVESITQDYDTEVTEPTEPTRVGYAFNGWYIDEELTNEYIFTTMPVQDLTLYAKWIINEYTINYYDFEEVYNPLNDIVLNVGETVTSISLGYYHSSAITSEGRVFTWGSNRDGQLGDGTTTNKNVPTEITSQFGLLPEETITSISLGGSHSSAISSEGRVFTWGFNGSGQLGDGTTTNKNVPTEITSQFGLLPEEIITSISLGGSHSSAITSEGRVFTWGENGSGQLGDGTTTNKSVPTEITSQFGLNVGEKITEIFLGGNHSSAITSEDRTFIWGSNNEYQLGFITLGVNSGYRSTPQEIKVQFELNEGEKVIQFSLGNIHSSAITSLGRLFTWGRNLYGQLGDGTQTYYNYFPTDITSQFGLNEGEILVSVSLGFSHSSAITSEGRVFTWGANSRGQLGDGESISKNVPTEITSQFGLLPEETITSISLGGSHSSAITSEGRVFTWGRNRDGQLGDGTTADRVSPYEIPTVSLILLHSITQEYDSSIPIYSPIKEGYTLDGWYVDYELTIEFTYSSIPAGDYNLYAKWSQIKS